MEQYILSDLSSALDQGIIDTDEYLVFLGYYYETIAAGYREGEK
jgi:hypothetical protein